MPVENILAAIGADADAAIAKVEADARLRVERAMVSARERAETEHARLALARSETAALEAARIVNRAKLAADRAVRDERERLFRTAVGRLTEALKRIRESHQYDAIFSRLLAEAREALTDADLIRVDPRDLERARTAVRDLGVPLRVDPSLSTLGGVELSTEDGRNVRNTFESRLERAMGDLRALAVDRIPELRGEG